MPSWSGHVALDVSDVYQLCEKLKLEGVKFLSDARSNRLGSRDLIAFIQDPGGYTIELTERHSRTGPPLKR